MIVVWNTGISNSTIARYAHLWKKMGRRRVEDVIILPYSRQRRDEELRRANSYNRRYVILVRPEFIPSPAFFDELDFLYSQKQYVVIPGTYTGLFEFNTDLPVEWGLKGICDAFIALQLSAQHKFTLPNKYIWEWFKKTNSSSVYKIPSRFVGSRELGAAMRNTLGEIIFNPFNKSNSVSFGKVITGGDKWYSKKTQNKMWENAISGWELWEEKK